MKNDSIPCDIVLLPNEDLSKKSIHASELISNKYDVFSSLDNIKSFVHLSLYMTQLNLGSIDEIKKILSSIASDFKQIYSSANGYSVDLGYIDVEYPRIDFVAIQSAVINAVNPLREGMRIKDEVRMKEASGLILNNYKKYGYPSVGELLRPHITFTRLKSFSSPNTNGILGDHSQFSGCFDRIGLFEMGDNGTCIRKIGEWKLQ